MATVDQDQLAAFRAELDATDEKIIDLLAQRAEIIGRLATVKAQLGVAPYQPERYSAMLEDRLALARERGLDTTLVVVTWNAIHESSLRQQTVDELHPELLEP